MKSQAHHSDDGFAIDRASWDDVPALCALKERVGRATYAAFATAEQLDLWVQRKCNRARFEPGFSDGASLFVARHERALVGMCLVHRRESWALITDLYVETPARGVGAALLHAACEQARTWGSVQLRAIPYSGNPRAINFFQRRGFTYTGANPSQTIPGINNVTLAKRV